jgi:hypothetical protein
MDEELARGIASARHKGQLDRSGRPMIDHLRRVAAAVPVGARSVAWLHDLYERTSTHPAELRFRGLDEVEAAALELLTRSGDEDYALYIWRIASAVGEAGVLARQVKLADLDDHLASPAAAYSPSPPYAWARHVLVAVNAELERRSQAVASAQQRAS